jgi:membrane-associated protease RseP (regulator of RpoE activity)
MKRLYLFVLACTLVMTAAAQRSWYYGINTRSRSVFLEGKQTDCWVVTGIGDFSPAYKAGVCAMDLIIAIDGKPVDNSTELKSKSQVALTIRRPGNRTLDISVTGVSVFGDYVSEERYAFRDVASESDFYVTQEKWDNAINIMSDPGVDLYSYATFDFEFVGENILQQKEMATDIENQLTNKGLSRDLDNPDLLVFIEFYSDRREQYVPPTQQLQTRYGTAYNWITRRIEVRQFVESEQAGDYTRVDYLSKLSIAMVDAKKARTENSAALVVWQADYETLSEKKANHKEFGKSIEMCMFYGFPFKFTRRVELNQYLFTGILYNSKVPGKVVGVFPDSPAEKAGIKSGDVIKKSTNGKNTIFKKSFNSLEKKDDEITRYNNVSFRKNFAFNRISKFGQDKSPFDNTYMSFWTSLPAGFLTWLYKDTNYDKNPPVFTVRGGDKKMRQVAVTPEKCFYWYFVLE